jgi:MFS family permease
MKYLSWAELFFNMARAMLLLSIAKTLFDETGQIWMISLSFVSEIFISALMPLLAGKYMDTHGVSGILRALSLVNIVIGLLVILALWFTELTALMILLLSMTLSALWRISRLCVFNLTPLLLPSEQLEHGNGQLTFNSQLGQLAGMFIAGTLLHYAGLFSVMSVITLCFCITAYGYFLATAQTPKQTTVHISTLALPATTDMLKQACKKYGLLFVVSDFDFTLLAIFNILLVSVVANNFAGNAIWMSGIDACYALGAMLGGMLVSYKRFSIQTRYSHVLAAQGVFILWLAVSTRPELSPLVIIASFAMGCFTSFSGIYWRTFLQLKLPAHARGTLIGVKFILSSLWIGLVSMVISWVYHYGFYPAMYCSLFIVIFQTGVLIFYKKKHQAEQEKKLVHSTIES